jgi:hypothetical protein
MVLTVETSVTVSTTRFISVEEATVCDCSLGGVADVLGSGELFETVEGVALLGGITDEGVAIGNMASEDDLRVVKLAAAVTSPPAF